MAFIEKMAKNTYRIIVCLGYDNNGKKLRKRKTIKLKDTLSPKQIEKELNKQKYLFEREVLQGEFLDGEEITFSEFTERWFRDYAQINLTPATITSYKQKLEERIIPAIGHIKLSKLQPTHLLRFYQNLHETDIRLDEKFIPNNRLIKSLNPVLTSKLEKHTGLSFKTCKRLKNGFSVDLKTAEKFCESCKIDIKKAFYTEKGKKLSEKTIRNHIGIIGSILSTAVKWNIIKDNPVKRIDLKKVSKSKAKYYDDTQVSKMLNALNSEPLMYKTMLYLSIDIGLRKSELTGLKWTDVDFKNSQVSINKQRHYVTGYGTIESKPKTEAGTRVVTVSKTVLNLLKQYRQEQIEQRLKLGTAWKNSPYIFLNEDGSEISPNQPYKWFIKFLERHNLPRITFHQLRHTNASLLISAGEDIVTVSTRLGHADKNITLNTYSHIIKNRDIQIANRMDEFFTNLKQPC